MCVPQGFFFFSHIDLALRLFLVSVPETAEDLCSLPGIGPKMAYLILSAAFDIHDGIGVDTHMHRIFNVLQWVTSKTPEQTREQLEGKYRLNRQQKSSDSVLYEARILLTIQSSSDSVLYEARFLLTIQSFFFFFAGRLAASL
jgi:hypothetical protein